MANKKLEFKAQQRRMNAASDLATDILAGANMLAIPVDPLALAATESHWLVVKSGNFKNTFDGLLEYHPNQNRFLLFFNNKYDSDPRSHHPRTRFSIAHELGHFYLDHHRAYLMSGGKSHQSKSEFASSEDDIIEREADAFAAGLLMPTPLFRPCVNQTEPSLDAIKNAADKFCTSLLSTAIRYVQHSDYPCEIVGIREGQIAWRFRPNKDPDPLTEGKCYRAPNGPLRSKKAKDLWTAFERGNAIEEEHGGSPQDWFQLFGPQYKQFTVWEHYLTIPIMNTLIVLLTVAESDLFPPDEDTDSE